MSTRFYAQDSWRVSEQLTVNYGIRYDLFQLANPKVKNPDPGLAAANLDTSLIPIDKNNIGGRLGFAYRLSRNGSTVVRGGVGNYYGRTPSILTGTAFTQNGIQVQTYTLTANLPAYPGILSAPPALNRTPDIYVFAKDYVQPLTWQWSLNVEHPLGRDYCNHRRLPRRARRASEPHPRYQFPAGGSTAGELRRRHAGHLYAPPGPRESGIRPHQPVR